MKYSLDERKLSSLYLAALEQFGDTILFTTDDEILEAMSRFDETFEGEGESPEALVSEEELQRPRTADGEGEERPFTQAGFRDHEQHVGLRFSRPPFLLVNQNYCSGKPALESRPTS